MPESSNFVKYCLMMHTGYARFPNIYFGEEHIGGIDDLIAYLQDQQTTDWVLDKNGISATTSDEETTSTSESCPNFLFEYGEPIAQ